jgi:hypothetical protein
VQTFLSITPAAIYLLAGPVIVHHHPYDATGGAVEIDGLDVRHARQSSLAG